MSKIWIATCVTAALLATQGCSRTDSPAQAEVAQGAIRLGQYRAVLTLPGGELPFGFEVAEEDGKYVAYLVNGAERVRVPEVAVSDGHIEALMPGFENRLSAQIDGDKLSGHIVLIKRGGKEQVIPFLAEYGVKYRFVDEPEPTSAKLAGRWAVTFVNEDGEKSPAVGEFRQNGNEATGTFLTPSGDHRFLAGDVQGNEFALSAFDGARAALYRGKITSSGATLEGTYWSGLALVQNFTAARDESASLDDAASLTTLRSESDGLAFTFPDIQGANVSLQDPRFAGKVVVITLGGSWCANCHDEMSFLAPYYIQNRDRGFEVIGLMFEHFDDVGEATAAVTRLRDKFGVQYPLLIAGTSNKDDVAKKLPQLNGFYAYPTTLFLDRKGRVRRIHTGFSGPSTGDHYQAFIDEFDATVDQLLAEADDPVASEQPPTGA